MVAPTVVQRISIDWVLEYVPLSGLKVGAATLNVYISEAVSLAIIVVAKALALIVVDTFTVIGPEYGVELDVGSAPLVV